MRLKERPNGTIRCEINKFQFQSGAIKRGGNLDELHAELISFQFQSGAIKRAFNTTLTTTNNGFNSSLVRLKDEIDDDGNYAVGMEFQFQSGAIKSLRVITPPPPPHRAFQFQSGAIKSHRVDRLGRRMWIRFNSSLVRLKELPNIEGN